MTLQLANPRFDGPETYSLADQKKAILERKTLGRRLRGTWQLRDNATGSLLEERDETLAQIPYLTQRGTFINNGVEYALVNQFRLRPGVFTRRKENDEAETHVNVQPGTGPSHRYSIDPAKGGVFFANIGQAKIPLVSLLHSLGITDRQLHKAWGPEVAMANSQADNPAAMRKYAERFLQKADLDGDQSEWPAKLAAALGRMKLDPEVTSRTMGRPVENMSAEALLDITKKLLAVSRGEADVDDRDNLAYQSVLGPDDLIAERLEKDYGGMRKKLAWRAHRDRNLKGAIPNYLNRQVQSALLGSGLGQALEEVNALELLDKQFRITRMGEGGISSSDTIPPESRAVNDSQYGYVDSIRTPESEKAGVDLFLSRAVKKGRDGKIYIPVVDTRTGQTVYRSPQELADSAIALSGELKKPGTRAWAIQAGKLRQVPKSRVAYDIPVFEDTFSPLANLVPFKSAMKGQRMAMGSRFLTQALALAHAEAPLVQAGIPGSNGDSYDRLYGAKVGAVRADKPARVLAVDKDKIRLRYEDGKTDDIELAVSFPFNRKSSLHQTALVKPGQVVLPGDMLARSNYTNDQGEVAMGLNARVAFLADEGNNFEDAISISESFAKKLAAENMYPVRLDPDDQHKLGRGSFMGLFPNKFNRSQLEKMDDKGVVKPGTVVQYGDPLILAARVNESSAGRIHRKGSKAFADASLTWDHHAPGEVTDVSVTNKGMAVLVKSLVPTQVADKLSGRYGNKGVVGRIISDDQMPHDKEGKPFEVLLNPLGIISRGNPASVLETALGKIAAKTGKPYRIPDFDSIQDLAEAATPRSPKLEAMNLYFLRRRLANA